MGTNIDRESFDAEDRARFAVQLRDDLEGLRALLALPDFGNGPESLGAELELSLVDEMGLALPCNQRVLDAAKHPQLTLELDSFNLEYNLSPVPASGTPFAAMADEMRSALGMLTALAKPHGAQIATIGILPTLRHSDLQASAMTDLPRYHALSNALRQIDIAGDESLRFECDDVTMEGAATSFQVHLRVPPGRFARLYNATQLATAPALALSTNSPIFLGRKLWHETRIALFKQAVDSRTPDAVGVVPPRVLFGRGWVEASAYELFAQAVASFPAILPAPSADDAKTQLAAGQIPALSALRLHTGTVWHWNRPVFDPGAGGHLRIEMRALPGGPTPLDMMASAAFAVGLSVGLEAQSELLIQALSFERAQHNFYQAAQFGPQARLLWPSGAAFQLREASLPELLPELLEHAHRGLEQLGVDASERRSLLGLIDDRGRAATTGSCWQRRMLDRFSAMSSRQEALQAMLQCYLRESETGKPVHEWRESA
jgi:gamma-glutamyl:cysteine ligase YbdK (ATP-grasp superfamily)